MEPKENQEMIDSTDSYEAVIVMKGMKNFLFWLLLVSLFISQAVFWMYRLGLVDKSDGLNCPAGVSALVCPKTCRPVLPLSAIVPLAAQTDIAKQAEQVVQKVERQAEIDPAEPVEADILIETPPQPEPAQTEVSDETPRDTDLERLRISGAAARGILRIVNFVIFMAAVLYCLTLLMNLKISLTGKLGGINHITRAFFCSLFLLVFLTPWQVLLPGVVVGAMYLPGELLCDVWAKADTSTFWKVLLYLRFTGLWLVVLWLLLCAQSRSVRWARATLRRLGMSR